VQNDLAEHRLARRPVNAAMDVRGHLDEWRCPPNPAAPATRGQLAVGKRGQKHRPRVRVQTETGTPSRDQTATGTAIVKVKDGLITEEVGLDDGISVLEQLGLIAQR
jgi:hypothetical protein